MRRIADSAVSMKSPSAGPSGSRPIVTPNCLQAGTARVQHFDGVGFGVVVRNAGQQVSLLRRAEHDHFAAQVGAHFGQQLAR